MEWLKESDDFKQENEQLKNGKINMWNNVSYVSYNYVLND